MNNRVTLLLVVVLAFAAGAFAIWRYESQLSRVISSAAPPAATTPALRAQARSPSPAAKQTIQAETPKPEPAPAATAKQPTDGKVDVATLTEPKTEPKTADEKPTPVVEATPPKPEKPAAAAPPAPNSPAKEHTPAVATAPAETQKPAATETPAKEPAPAVATPAPNTEKPAKAETPEKNTTPVVTASPPAAEKLAATEPTQRMPAPVVTTTPPVTEKPAKTEAPETKTTPVATTSPPAIEKPAVTEPPQQKPAPVVTAPAPQNEKPAAAAAPAHAPVVAALTPEPTPKPSIVMTPLPEKRPAISKATIEKTSPAKYLFGAKKLPSNSRARAIGYYPRGCLAGGVELPVNGPTWQVMRLSRNRNWGHPELVRFLERFAPAAAKATGWPGILVGDMAQPRGGPLPFGHRSHQIGLDVDIWFMPMPDHRLSRKQRETISATHLVASNGKELNRKTWTPETAKFIRVAAQQPEVERVLVNAAIKKELCRLKGKSHWSWMAKVRPWYGHDDHIHVRLKCPANSPHCRHQPAVPGGDGCSKKALAFWFSDRVLHPRPAKHPKPRKQIMLSDLPAACKLVLNAPAKKSHLASETR